jgi:hypothetical protein
MHSSTQRTHSTTLRLRSSSFKGCVVTKPDSSLTSRVEDKPRTVKREGE